MASLPDIPVLDLEPLVSSFQADVEAGLSRSPKFIPCKYFYDRQGAQLFDRITRLPEYYLTRAELEILQQHAPEMASCLGSGVQLVEFGSGSSVKTRRLLDALCDPVAYVPVDISREQLLEAARGLLEQYPDLPVRPVIADYGQRLELPQLEHPASRTAAYFPGSTLGNFQMSEAHTFLSRVRRLVGGGGCLLIGLDLVKDPSIIEAAYDDAAGVTARFNLNLLHRMRRELGARVDPGKFQHLAIWNPERLRIEMYLQSTGSQVIQIGQDSFALAPGERIHTEHCHKYTPEIASQLARSSGFRVERSWTDSRDFFSVQFWSAAE